MGIISWSGSCMNGTNSRPYSFIPTITAENKLPQKNRKALFIRSTPIAASK
jgi:hypothetical protein